MDGVGIEPISYRLTVLHSRRRDGVSDSYVFLPTASPPGISAGQLQKDANC